MPLKNDSIMRIHHIRQLGMRVCVRYNAHEMTTNKRTTKKESRTHTKQKKLIKMYAKTYATTLE